MLHAVDVKAQQDINNDLILILSSPFVAKDEFIKATGEDECGIQERTQNTKLHNFNAVQRERCVKKGSAL